MKYQKLPFTVLLLLVTTFNVMGQGEIISLWEGEVPNQRVTEEKEHRTNDQIVSIRNVQQPTLEVFLPVGRNQTSQAIIICPGGGYGFLAYDWEGTDIAKWLSSKEIAVFVLKYRLPNSKSLIDPHEVPLIDAKRAIRTVRYHADRRSISKENIGIMGFSTGGHLASTLATHYEADNDPKDEIDKVNARPDFTILIYPVITMNDSYTHMGSRVDLLGKDANSELVDYYSNELHIDVNTPPTFLVHSSDDKVVPVMNSILFYQEFQKEKIYSEMHVYPFGGHGYATALGRDYLETWPRQLEAWLKRMNSE